MKVTKISTRVINLREALGLTQEELAAKLYVSFATINRWENGKNVPQRRQMEMIEQLEKQSASLLAFDKRAAQQGWTKCSKRDVFMTATLNRILECVLRIEKKLGDMR